MELHQELFNSLSPREKEILKLYTYGKRRQEIADTLFISRTTVCTHLNNIFSKLGVSCKELTSIIYWKNNLEELNNLDTELLI